MRALVTGATGLIGAHIVRALLGAGYDVRCLVRPTSCRDDIDKLPVTCVISDVTQAGSELDAACRGCNVVFHTAAHFAFDGFSSDDLRRTAVNGTEAVLTACAEQNVEKVVVTSSSVVFGYTLDGSVACETARVAAASDEPPYVRAKVGQHRHALHLADELGLDVRLACPTMTIGPTLARLGPSNRAIIAYLSDPFCCSYPGGCNLVAARDVAIGHLAIAEHGTPGESYLLGSSNMTWHQVHSMIAELVGVPPPRFQFNRTTAYLAAAGEEIRAALTGRPPLSTRQQAGMVDRHYWYSHEKAAELGYSPAPARDAMIEALSWLATTSYISREIRTGMRLSPAIYRFRAAMETRLEDISQRARAETRPAGAMDKHARSPTRIRRAHR
jgi:dihydroflavonol-4-reductase